MVILKGMLDYEVNTLVKCKRGTVVNIKEF